MSVIFKYLFVCTALFFTISGHAQAQNSTNPTINLNIPPEVSAGNKAYKDIFATLTSAQQAELKALDKMVVSTILPDGDIKAAKTALESCRHPSITDDNKQALFNNFRLYKTDNRIKATKALKRRISEIDYIDRALLVDHLVFEAALSEGLRDGMTQIVLQNGISQEICDVSFKEMLEASQTPYVSMPVAARVRDMGEKMYIGDAVSCNSGYDIQINDTESISLAILFMKDSSGDKTLEYSAKIRIGRMNNFKSLQDAQLNFSGFDTRELAKAARVPSGRTIIGVMRHGYAVAMLNSLRDGEAVVSVATEYWDEPYSAYLPIPHSNQLDQFASCISNIAPEMKNAFREQGYSTVLTVSGKHVGKPL